MKKFALIICLLLISSFGYSQSKKMLKFKKEYTTLEYVVKTKTDSLNYHTTQKINKLSYKAKTELSELEEKYGSSNLKIMLYHNKYNKEVSKVNTK